MKRYLFLLLAALLLPVFSGCATNRDMARIVYSPQAEGDFFDHGGAEKYNYYVYEGPGSRTVAYLALDKKYTLQSQFWYQTALSKAIWQEVGRDTDYMGRFDYWFREITTSDSQTIGYLVSRYHQLFAWFVEPGSTTVVVPPPELSPLQPENFRFNRNND